MGKIKYPHESLSAEVIKLLNILQVNSYFISNTQTTLMQDVTTFLDSPKFLLSLPQIRKKVGVTNTPLASYDTLSEIDGQFTLIRDKKTPLSKYSFSKILTSFEQWRKIFDYWHPQNHPKRRLLVEIAQSTLSELKRPYYLGDIFFQSVILGVTGWNQDPIIKVGNNKYVPAGMAIIVNPRTTYTDIKSAIRQIKTSVFSEYTLPDYVTHVMDYRYWYWQKLKGFTYAEIAEEIADQKLKEIEEIEKHVPNYIESKSDKFSMNIGEIDVIKGVRKYASLLDF